ncbi:hypothetical protein [Natrononativus amylolyticus]|uniref:hypothetical protein n=1 Tax=Natrononativus amylolyticus TaxID=2963434 RepID=UPI0020CE73FE|nr:hypothetical protein [Natrononativus amylolyticus]
MSVDVTRHEPDDDPPWIEAEHEGARYEYQIVGEDRLQLTATGGSELPLSRRYRCVC